jgi:hypothetical protein
VLYQQLQQQQLLMVIAAVAICWWEPNINGLANIQNRFDVYAVGFRTNLTQIYHPESLSIYSNDHRYHHYHLQWLSMGSAIPEGECTS